MTEMPQVREAVRRPQPKHAVFLLLVTVLVYVQTVTFPFLHFDDTIYISNNTYTQQWRSVPSFFNTYVNQGFTQKSARLPNMYRPFTSCWVLLNYKLFGQHAALWHLGALIFYALGVWLFWRLAFKLSGSDFVALAAALLYALHPLHVEGVAWISGAYVETLVAVLFFGGFLAYLRWREDQKTKWLVLCGVLILLGLLSKESVAALPILIACHALLFGTKAGEPGERSLGHLAPLALVFVVSVGIYAILRFHAIHGVLAPNSLHSWGEVFRAAPSIFVSSLQHTFWPAHLSPWYDSRIANATGWSGFYLPLIICVIYVTLTLWTLVRKPLVGFLLLWWLVLLTPATLGTIGLSNDLPIVQDRFTFLALASLSILVAWAVSLLPGRGLLFGSNTTCTLVFAVLAAALGVKSALQVNTWRDDVALAQHGIEVAPRTLRPRVLLASSYARRRDNIAAAAAYRDAVELFPENFDLLFEYGIALASVGNRPEAIQVLTRATGMNPTSTPLYFVTADLLAQEGKLDDAIGLLERGIPIVKEPDLLRLRLGEFRNLQRLRANSLATPVAPSRR